jgi:hypothetical protein
MNLRTSLIRCSLAVACAGLATASLAQDKAQPAPDAKARMAAEAAFSKADVNADGKLSKEEAAKLPAIRQGRQPDAGRIRRRLHGGHVMSARGGGAQPPSRASFSLFQ